MDQPPTNPFAALIAEHGDDVSLTTDGSVDDLLSGEAARHFPEKRNRRRGDRDVEVIARLHEALETIDNGGRYEGLNEEDDGLVMSDYYRQF